MSLPIDTDVTTEEFMISFTSSLTEALEALSVSLSSLNSILLFHNDYKTGMYNYIITTHIF